MLTFLASQASYNIEVQLVQRDCIKVLVPLSIHARFAIFSLFGILCSFTLQFGQLSFQLCVYKVLSGD